MKNTIPNLSKALLSLGVLLFAAVAFIPHQAHAQYYQQPNNYYNNQGYNYNYGYNNYNGCTYGQCYHPPQYQQPTYYYQPVTYYYYTPPVYYYPVYTYTYPTYYPYYHY